MLPLHNGVKKKKLNIDGSYSNNGIQNDVSLTIPVNGTSYPPNSPYSNPMGCSEPFVGTSCPNSDDPCSPS